MTIFTKEVLQAAHTASGGNGSVIAAGGVTCGCFYCLKKFPSDEIVEWVHDNTMPLCPHCGIDSVLGENQGFDLTPEFLQAMHDYYFNFKSL